MWTIDKLVREMIDQHEGGRVFFDNLDENLRNKRRCDELYKLAHQYSYYSADAIVLSGKFGLMFYNWLRHVKEEPDIEIFLLPGGLRKVDEIHFLDSCAANIRDKKLIFFDDSFHSGNTRNVIADHIGELGGELVHSFVCYDGNEDKDEEITSLYRYYDKNGHE